VELFGIRFVGLTAENGRKLVLTLVLFLLIWLLRQILRVAIRAFQRVRTDERAEFWTRQGINLGLTLLTIIGLLSIWFSDPTRLATALGLITAGLAFALQRVITSVAGYFVILRGNTFSIGDRISMGGVRGDVIALGLIQTTIMEMGEPPNAQGGTSPAYRSTMSRRRSKRAPARLSQSVSPGWSTVIRHCPDCLSVGPGLTAASTVIAAWSATASCTSAMRSGAPASSTEKDRFCDHGMAQSPRLLSTVLLIGRSLIPDHGSTATCRHTLRH
jgi:hypothetical protein